MFTQTFIIDADGEIQKGIRGILLEKGNHWLPCLRSLAQPMVEFIRPFFLVIILRMTRSYASGSPDSDVA